MSYTASLMIAWELWWSLYHIWYQRVPRFQRALRRNVRVLGPALTMQFQMRLQVIKTIYSLKFSKWLYRFKFISERRHLKILSPNWDISKSYRFSAQKCWICMVQMLNMAIKQAFASNLLTNYENIQYLNTAPVPLHWLFETTKFSGS